MNRERRWAHADDGFLLGAAVRRIPGYAEPAAHEVDIALDVEVVNEVFELVAEQRFELAPNAGQREERIGVVVAGPFVDEFVARPRFVLSRYAADDGRNPKRSRGGANAGDAIAQSPVLRGWLEHPWFSPVAGDRCYCDYEKVAGAMRFEF